MAYPKESYEEAHRILSERRDNNRIMTARRNAIVKERFPEVARIRAEIAGTGAELVKNLIAIGNSPAMFEELKNRNLKKQQELRNYLKSLDLPENYLDEQHTCSKCEDRGVIGSRNCECLTDLLRKITYDRLGVPASFANCSFDNFSLLKYSSDKEPGTKQSIQEKMANVLKNSKEYAMNFNENSSSIYMCGNPGLGKTHLSIAIAKTVIDKGFNVMYLPFYQLINSLEAAKFGRSDDNYNELIKTVNEAEFLILDDVGTEFPNQFAISTLYGIINTRLLSGKPSLINSNLSVAAIEERYTPRVASRIAGEFRVITFAGTDIRYTKAYNKEV